MQPSRGVVIGGKYHLTELLASGGMGSVWGAHHAKLDAHVAVKFMSEELASSEEMRARFEREAQAAAKLRSPHVVQVLDFGVEDGMPYIVMERLEGMDLRRRLKQFGKLSLRDTCWIVKQACKALRLASEAGIVHRDLKPGNIWLSRSGDDETVKILDFGVAKASTPTRIGVGTTSGVLLGSPHYMSPEQARGLDLDHRSDLFSMGVIIFRMLTGQKPFRGKDLGDVIVKICSEPIPVATELAPDLPPSVNAFFAKALARKPEDRFQSARELSAAFASLVADVYDEPPPSHSGATVRGPDLMVGELSYDESPTILSPPDMSETPKPGTLTNATRSVSTIPGKPSSSAWIALVGLLVAGAVFYFVAKPADTQTAAPELDTQVAPAATPTAVDEKTAAPKAPASTTPAVSASASAASSSAPAPTRPRTRPAPVRMPAPATAPEPPPVAPKPDGKHPVLGI